MKDNDSAIVSSRVAVVPATDLTPGPWASLSPAWRGSILAGLGVLSFSGSFPATVFAMRGFDPYLVAIGRAAVAAVAALALLLVARVPLLPPRTQLRSYLVIVAGVVFGFPLFSGLALDAGASASHAAVVIGLLPAATAACAVLRGGERPRPLFWVSCALGAVAITAFTLSRGGEHATGADLLLVGALGSAAVGYTEGGRLARETSGWRVISHALVVAAPLTVPATVILALSTEPRPGAASLAGFAYVGLVSMFLGFIPWYAGLATGGIARAGQTQLAQPLLTLLWAWLLLGERFGPATVAAALAVLVCVALTQRARS
ncbi:DMT family transporter [Streptosporangium sp. NBC_01756]|uniref:DMT family transporter n=1 Tax=Streptosporangium sp. NBC_01756 TaxID=2975950 RepID=UPI002DD97C89|nr:DMT family transporter [Streptosporangium sp. NBC_01756]WSC84415.1 DMT family transporter [Streptosporangium sp. NBC_01756]